MKFKKQPLNDITFEITDVCQLRCKRCSIWRGAGRHEIAPAFFMATMKRLLEVFRVYSVSLTGGEPFLYPKIAELLKYLALLRTGKKITGFGIYTSGVNTEIIDKVMRGSRSFLQGMCVGISVDGASRTHDVLRGKGTYDRMAKTVRLFRDKYLGVCDVEVKFTASDINCKDLFDVYMFAVNNGARFTPKLAEENVGFYYHRHGFGDRKYVRRTGASFWKLFRQQIMAVLKEESRRRKKSVDPEILKMLLHMARHEGGGIKKCRTPERSLFITSFGDVYPCLYLPSAGSIYEKEPFSKCFFDVRKNVIKKAMHADCPRCLAYHGFLKKFNSKFLD